jgi:uncharacterized membrane protein YphA (DoxX/SURF4 family)
MAIGAFVGRVLFAVIFIMAGLEKLQKYDPVHGGPATAYTTPKLHGLTNAIKAGTGYDLPLETVRLSLFVVRSLN